MIDKSTSLPTPGHRTTFDNDLESLQQMLLGEANTAVSQVDAAVKAFRTLDAALARNVRKRDNEVDENEVEIEEACIRLIALHQPVASDLRRLTVYIRVNSDIERIADHATGVCKSVLYLGDAPPPIWPQALLDMADRVAPRCRQMLTLLRNPDVDKAKALIAEDVTLDRLGKLAFKEIESAMPMGALSQRSGLLAFRAMRDLERIGDLCGDISEDLIYLVTGTIIRHARE